MAARHALAVLALALAAGAFHWTRLDHGWKPYDEGTLAHSAERVRAGELPHRDFDDVYTGGLAFLNAAAYRTLGEDLRAPRVFLLVLYVAAVPAVYYLASRFLAPPGALIAAALALTWNVPIYPAAMPSWYNLLLALIGTALLVRYTETGRSHWIVAAGALAGVSITMKITGLFFVAAVLLWLLFCAQEEARRHAPGGAGRAAFALHVAGVLAFAGAVVALLLPRMGAAELVYFVAPVVAVAALLVRREVALHAARLRVVTPWRRAALFLLGTGLPLLVFVAPYVASGSVGALLNGVFLSPVGRISGASIRPPAPWTIVAGAPLAAVLYFVVRHGRAPRSLLVGLAALLAGALALGHDGAGFRLVVASMRWVPVVAVVAAVLVLWRGADADNGRLRGGRALFLLTALTAIVSLIQYPLAHPLYLWYVAPIAVLAIAGTSALRATAPPVGLALLALFYIVFSVQEVLRQPSTTPLGIERASLYVTAADAMKYRRAVALLQAHARGGYTWAGPDTPELYFLARLHNPTRHLFEFLAQHGEAAADIRAGIERHDVTAIALNREHFFSDLPAELVAELERRFPESERVGNLEIRWRP